MPNRVLREGILSSERVNALGWEAEVFYRRLMSVVDDYGRFSAHPSLLRAALYPLKLDTVGDTAMHRLLAAVVQARLAQVYEVGGKTYLELLDFRQQVRAKDSKYPDPPRAKAGTRTAAASHCIAPAAQVRADVPHVLSQAAHTRTDEHAGARQLSASAHLGGGEGVGKGEGECVVVVEDDPTAAVASPACEQTSGAIAVSPADAQADSFAASLVDSFADAAPFRMVAHWRPSAHMAALAQQAGLAIPASAAFNAALGEFIAYWLSQSRKRTQHEWDHALIKSLKAEQWQTTHGKPRASGRRANAGHSTSASTSTSATASTNASRRASHARHDIEEPV